MKNQVILTTNPKRSLTLIVRFDEDLRRLDCQPFVVCFLDMTLSIKIGN